MSIVRNVTHWLEERTGLASAVHHFLYEEIPPSSGWHQVFGSLALFLFLTQVFTGILLAINYAPTPGEAYHSLSYIVNELTAGRMIRGLHHWGASMMIVVVVLHMTQVFLYGAYKKPREGTWMVGVVLLTIVLGFGLSGYLLPWDNRAYWGTIVTTQIAGQAPILGPYIQRLMGAENGVGAVTFARFYSAHVLMLPPLTIILIGLHLYLVRKHGVAPEAIEHGPKKMFYPGQVFKDTVAIFIAFAILFTMAVTLQVPLEPIADPTNTSYIPRPEWYFLFLFQTLKFFKGSLEPIGSVFLPNITLLVLMFTPFIDRGPLRRLRERKVGWFMVIGGAVAWTGLTTAAVLTTPKQSETPLQVAAWNRVPPKDLTAFVTFNNSKCSTCHNLSDGDPKPGPNLAGITAHKPAAWMLDHFKAMTQQTGAAAISDTQAAALAAMMGRLTPDTADGMIDAPAAAIRGAEIYESHGCSACHQINGEGMAMGPGLNGVGQRRTKAWLDKHLENPRSMSPGSIMPPYKLSKPDLEALDAYLLALGGS